MDFLNSKIVWLALLLFLATLIGGCGSAWKADDVQYQGKAGLQLSAGGFDVYIGLPGQIVAKGSAESGEPQPEPDGE
jgi:hypothetical protein